MITKMIAGAAIALGVSLLGAVPANADPGHQANPPSPNPFAGLTCNCQKAPPLGGPNMAEVQRGLQAALAS
jgi:hypothetical protein